MLCMETWSSSYLCFRKRNLVHGKVCAVTFALSDLIENVRGRRIRVSKSVQPHVVTIFLICIFFDIFLKTISLACKSSAVLPVIFFLSLMYIFLFMENGG